MAIQEKNALKAVSGMMVVTLLGKVLGLYRDILFANNYGLGMEANAFTTASLIPRTFFDAVFASAITASFIPVFNEYMGKEGEKRAFSFANVFITLVGVFTLFFTVIGMIFAEPFAQAYAAGFDEATLELCTELLRMLFPTVFFTGLAYCFVGILQSMEEFTIPAALSIVSNGAIILYYFVGNDTFGVIGLAVAFLVGWLLQVLIQVPALHRKGYRFRLDFRWREPGLRKVLVLMIPVMVSTWIQPINLAVGVHYASYLFDGSGSTALNNANNLYSIILGVFVLSVINVIFPRMSRMVTEGREDTFTDTINDTLMVLLFLLVPMMVGLWCMSDPLVRLLYERNQFTPQDTIITARALRYLSLGTIGYGVYLFLSRAFYAKQQARGPMIAGILSMVLNAIFCILLMDRFDVAGISAASAIASLASAAWLAVSLHRQNSHCLDKQLWIPFIKIVIASLLMGVGVTLCYGALAEILPDQMIGRILLLAVPAGVGVILYAVCSIALGIPQARYALNLLQGLRKKGGN